jgi:hypothetical protein
MAEDIEASFASLREVPNRLYEGYIFDLDGTIYLSDELLPGAKRSILTLRDLGKRSSSSLTTPLKIPRCTRKS